MGKIKFVSIVAVSLLVQYLLLPSLSITADLITNLVVFLSIVFGFCATSLAILSTSTYIGILYKIKDSNKRNRQTLLDSMVGDYRAGLVISLFSIIYLLGVQLIIENSSELATPILNLGSSLAFAFLPAVVLNFVYGYTLLDVLSKVVIQQAKRNAE